MSRLLGKLVVTGLGTGYLPLAPGTWASAATCGVFLLAAWLSVGAGAAASCVMLAVLVVSSILCVALGAFAEEVFGRKDPRRCVLDEWAGQALSCLLLPMGMVPRDWAVAAVVAFLAFRVFDIVKPPPARRLEKLPRGWGVLLDDLVAGVYANATAQVALRWCYFGSPWGTAAA